MAYQEGRAKEPGSAEGAAIERGVGGRFLATSLFQASLVAYGLLGWLEVGPLGLRVLALAATLNLLAFVTRRTRAARVAHVLSPLWGVATWSLLVYLSGGVHLAGGTPSLFVVGLLFEVLVAPLVYSPAAIAGLAALAVVGLWSQQLALGLRDALGTLSLLSSFLLVVGASTGWLRRQVLRRQEGLTVRLGEQEARLASIEAELEDAQTLAALGERSARLGHGLKNAVHSLRGFSALIARKGDVSPRDAAALAGLKDAIDQLELLAQESLHPEHPRPEREQVELRAAVEGAVGEASAGYPGVRWDVRCDEASARRSVPRGIVHEVLTNLLKNAAESMEGRGEVTVQVGSADGRCAIQVSDQGPGIAPEEAERVFRAGYSTKTTGHGMGLFVARRLLESHGGDLRLVPNGTGAAFRIALPAAWKV